MAYLYERMVSQHLDVRAKSGREWQCLCPFHEDTSPSFSVNISSGLFICYACGAKGNGEALSRKLGGRVLERLPDSIDNLIGQIEEFERATHPQQRVRIGADVWQGRYCIGTTWAEHWENRLGAAYSQDLADRFALGYDYIQHALVIPIFDWNGSADQLCFDLPVAPP